VYAAEVGKWLDFFSLGRGSRSKDVRCDDEGSADLNREIIVSYGGTVLVIQDGGRHDTNPLIETKGLESYKTINHSGLHPLHLASVSQVGRRPFPTVKATQIPLRRQCFRTFA
jgi:hypothetical protein